jgi:tetratricopeptide (TPR) repeat protein
MLTIRRYKSILYGFLFLGGLACFGLAFHQHQYMQLIAVGNRAVAEQRFDSQEYEHVSRFWLAKQDILLFNQAILAYKAHNFPQAVDQFRRVSQRTHDPGLQVKTLYNLGVVMLKLNEVEGAAELFKEALRIDPQDQQAKFNLERLYQWAQLKEGDPGEASLQQAPGLDQEKGKDPPEAGASRSTPQSNI